MEKNCRKVRDGPATDTCNSPALPLLLHYFHLPGCPVRVQLPVHPVLGPAAPSLVSQRYSCAELSQEGFPELSLTLLPLAMVHLMEPNKQLNWTSTELSSCHHQSKSKSRHLSLKLPQMASRCLLKRRPDTAILIRLGLLGGAVTVLTRA